MCGGCGRSEIGDWLAPAVSSRQAREFAARTANKLTAGAPRVVAASSGFSVRFPTGRTAVVPTLTALWREVLRHRAVTLPEPPAPPVSTAPLVSMAPEVPSGRLAVLVADRTETVDRLAPKWGATTVIWCRTTTSLDELVAVASTPRLLLAVRAHDLDGCLALVTHPIVRLRTTVSALLHDGTGPAWASDVRAVDSVALPAILDGWSPAAEAHDDLRLPEAAAWLGGLVESGGTGGRRVTWAVEGGNWVLDAAAGRGLAVRPRVTARVPAAS
jgi:hypothetical protein